MKAKRVAWNKGLSKDTDERLAKHGLAVSKSLKGCKGRQWDTAAKERQSAKMLEVVKENPSSYNYDNVCRRVQRFEYKGSYFHSSWEVIVAKFLEENNLSWSRKVEPSEYLWENKVHLYFPDFYVPELDIFIEVKGYEVKKDREKWKQFKKKLVVLKEKEVNEIIKGSFDIKTLGV